MQCDAFVVAPRALLNVVQQLSNRTAHSFYCLARLEQSHRASMRSLRYTVHPEHNRIAGFINCRATTEQSHRRLY
jgi:hypothetical protein